MHHCRRSSASEAAVAARGQLQGQGADDAYEEHCSQDQGTAKGRRRCTGRAAVEQGHKKAAAITAPVCRAAITAELMSTLCCVMEDLSVMFSSFFASVNVVCCHMLAQS